MDVQQRDSFSVLFVCTGNLCRSPMAEALFKRLLKSRNLPEESSNWQVASAGTWAENGEPASLGAQIVMKKRGLDLNSHRSQRVNGKLLSRYKLVLVMEAGQKEALKVEFPKFAQKIYLLSEMAGMCGDVEDPMGGTVEDYETAADEIEGLLKQGFEKIKLLAKY